MTNPCDKNRPSSPALWFVKTSGIAFLGALLSAGVLLAGEPDNRSPLGARPVNPALKRFGRSVILYASFDGHEKAEITPGDPTPVGDAKWAQAIKDPSKRYAAGVHGQALRATEFGLTYACKNDVLGSTGAMTLWIKPETMNHKGSYWWPVRLGRLDGSYEVFFGRMGDPRNHEIFYAYLQHPKGGVSTCAGSMEAWKPGEWHLFVVNWDRTAVELSVDGGAPVRASLPASIEAHSAGGLRAVLSGAGDNEVFVVDEFMVLNVPLREAEIRWLWDEGRKAIKP